MKGPRRPAPPGAQSYELDPALIFCSASSLMTTGYFSRSESSSI